MDTSATPTPQTPCTRCGNYAALSPFWGHTLCGECIARAPGVLQPLTDVRSIYAEAFALVPRVGPLALLLSLIADIPSLLRDLATHGDSWRGTGWFMLLDEMALAVVTQLAVNAALGTPVSVTTAVGTLGRRFGLFLRSYLLSSLYIFGLLLLLVVPGIKRGVEYAVTTPITLLEPIERASEALQRSQARIRGHGWTVFFMHYIFVGVVWTPVLVGTVLAVALDAQDSLDSPAFAIATHVLATGLGSFGGLLLAVVYLKTAPREVAARWRLPS